LNAVLLLHSLLVPPLGLQYKTPEITGSEASMC
jgi:hypothetical protein